ncbi:polyketide synthase [Streptomyces sp. ISID311]|uniref:polyketide synthase n=1 Tax=Streptomyces sp. ISID311 TaxID=2601673 RepID=UPI0011BD3387|nr:polyketide synthase [Streptomyces sp. ISID311]TXC99871.1 crotonase [Streptomyces sp. ISID311]
MTDWEEAGVSVRLYGPVAEVNLCDTEHNNGITPGLRDRLPRALDFACAQPPTRVVILTGRPDVFCSGGTLEDLAAPGPPRAPLAWDFVTSPLTCPLPVIVAAQGHAIGGGLLLALYADLTILSDRSSYAANFLSYGFTPCLGATYLVPSALGPVLGHEMLYTARPYRGRELAARGAGTLTVPHSTVLERARHSAGRMAQAPRPSLELLKRQIAPLRLQAAHAAFQRELPDHAATLASPQTRQLLGGASARWSGSTDPSPAPLRPPHDNQAGS